MNNLELTEKVDKRGEYEYRRIFKILNGRLTRYPKKHGEEEKEKATACTVAFGTSNGNRTHDFALRGQRLDRLTMEA